MTIAELKEKNIDGLRAHIIELKRQLLQLKMAKATSQLTTTHKIRQTRRAVAQAKTVLHAMIKGSDL